MSIQFAILGLLSLRPMTGYDLKKIFADSEIFYWSDNNNLIYRNLVDLHHSEMVTREILNQENYPARKVYTLTEKGRMALSNWVQSTPELPEIHHSFLIKLEFAQELEAPALDEMLGNYEQEIQTHLLMLNARDVHSAMPPARNGREMKMREAIHGYLLTFYQNELEWIKEIRNEE